jgi:hypothetical protein
MSHDVHCFGSLDLSCCGIPRCLVNPPRVALATPTAALSGPNRKAPGFAEGYLLAKGSALDIPGPEHGESAKHDHRRPRLTAMIRPVFQAGGGYELVLRAPQG